MKSNEFYKYWEAAGRFSSQEAIDFQDVKMNPTYQWVQYGGQTPHLQKVALRILSQVCSSSVSERNWKSWDFIHSKRRNALSEASYGSPTTCKTCTQVVAIFAARPHNKWRATDTKFCGGRHKQILCKWLWRSPHNQVQTSGCGTTCVQVVVATATTKLVCGDKQVVVAVATTTCASFVAIVPKCVS